MLEKLVFWRLCDSLFFFVVGWCRVTVFGFHWRLSPSSFISDAVQPACACVYVCVCVGDVSTVRHPPAAERG
jgi:hypothetical protein